MNRIVRWIGAPLPNAALLGVGAVLTALAFVHDPLFEWLVSGETPGMDAIDVAGGAGAAAFVLLLLIVFHFAGRRRLGAAQLESPEKRFRDAMRGSLQGMLIHRNLRPIFCNRAFAEMIGFDSPEEILAMEDLVSFVHPADREWVVERTGSRLAGNNEPTRYEVRVIRKDGAEILLETLSLMVSWEGEPAIQAAYFDITEQRRAEEALRLSELSYRTLFDANSRILEHSPAGIILLDRDLRVVYENPGIRPLFYTEDEPATSNVGRPIGETPAFRGGAFGNALDTLARGRKITVEAQLPGDGKQPAFVSLKGVPIVEEDRLTGAVLLVTDITDRRRYEDTLRNQDRLLKAVAEARKQLLFHTDRQQAFQGALEALGRNVGVAGIAIFENRPGDSLRNSRVTLTHEWHADPSHTRLGKSGFEGISHAESGFSRWFDLLSAGHAINGIVREMPEIERKYLESENIRSIIAVPIFAGSLFWGFIGFVDRRDEQVWSRSEEAILLAVAESMGNFVERQIREAALRAEEERFRNLIEGSIQGILIHRDFEFLFVNQAYADIFGYDTPDEMLRMPDPMVLFPPWERERIIAYKNARMRGEEAPVRYEFQGIRRDGSTVWLEVINRLIAWNGETAIQATVFDVTERKKAEENLLSSNDRYHRLAENLPGMVFQFLQRPDGSQSYPYVSPSGLALLGLDAEEVARDAEPMLNKFHPDDRIVFERVLRESARTLSVKRYEGRYYNAEGQMGWARIMARPSRLPNGDLLWDGLLLDITREKMEERAQLLSESATSVRAPLRQIAANLATLLQSLRGHFTEIRRLTPETRDGRLGGAMDAARATWERTSEVIGELSAMVAGDTKAKPLLQIEGLIRDAVHRAFRGTDIRYRLEIDRDLHPLDGDFDTYIGALDALMRHALLTMNLGGELIILAENARGAGPLRLGAAADRFSGGDHVRVRLTNPGHGSIFQSPAPDRQSDRRAGPEPDRAKLEAARAAIESQGGWIPPGTPPGEVGTFTFCLPAMKGPSPGAQPQAHPQWLGRNKVLVIEPDATVRKRFRQTLRESGYAPAFAIGPAEAANRYRQSHEWGRPFTAVIIGLLPSPEEAAEVLRRLRDIDPEVKVVSATESRPLEQEMVEVVESPFQSGILRAALARIRGVD